MSYLFKINKDNKAMEINRKQIGYEKIVQDLLLINSEITGEKILYLGREIKTERGRFLDLLGIDSLGRFNVVEVKNVEAPADVIRQVSDYTTWLSKLPIFEIEQIVKDQLEKGNIDYTLLHKKYESFFNNEFRLDRNTIIDVVFAPSFKDNFIAERPTRTTVANKVDIIYKFFKFEFFEDLENRYIMTQPIGEDGYESEGSYPGSKAVGKTGGPSHLYKKLILDLCKKLEAKFGDWANGFGVERDPFSKYQSKDGTFIESVLWWNNGFTICCGLCREETTEQYKFFTRIISRKITGEKKNLIMDYIEKNNFEEKEGYLGFFKYSNISIDPETILNTATDEIEKLKPIIEKILG
ncbi:hypothetical protein COY52_09645 [Candidatus Desantisbacteria bacterium CG_4_10_14_0_8_um_filter_48_22]|uniref:DUF91 domain-containing protein n=1 Tax=Candidatus Desantisbacteria bacterium CG_4_10_14_0_8_um_filter_48_22 TaxID=1974543 RepID=A0A2M7S7J2_9BACT|nr:MAG: hypothetical protein AUJ67_00510 [Candidatus Desantisbacteria bacterium CG1_02_49_89]PIV55961.1 MAG: hypothetical protein COS16_05500 [Candidatus Desantisbacteria bacterium CG02_land_8_20_14_3_00_49_13]PIZ15501.1 MAG: hypothetical protein COY52_09645 [Candidatus Desantisbacteria bacterium CG_4_10_14_0_8_um_filter_48_22]